jgi:hypothetical protein
MSDAYRTPLESEVRPVGVIPNFERSDYVARIRCRLFGHGKTFPATGWPYDDGEVFRVCTRCRRDASPNPRVPR